MANRLEPLRAPGAVRWFDGWFLDYIVDGLRPFAGSVAVDQAERRALVARIVDRTTNIESSLKNHWVMDQGEPVRARLGEIRAPTLVIHGTDDPLFPYAHAEALAAEIPEARLLPLAGVGHEYPPPSTWEAIVPAILRLATAS